MSLIYAKAFMEQVMRSRELQDRLAACRNREERFSLAKEPGYTFTADDLKSAGQN